MVIAWSWTDDHGADLGTDSTGGGADLEAVEVGVGLEVSAERIEG